MFGEGVCLYVTLLNVKAMILLETAFMVNCIVEFAWTAGRGWTRLSGTVIIVRLSLSWFRTYAYEPDWGIVTDAGSRPVAIVSTTVLVATSITLARFVIGLTTYASVPDGLNVTLL